MRKYMNHFLRSGLIRISGFHQRECLIPSEFTWTVSCLPVCLTAIDISGIKRFRSQFRSQVQTEHRGMYASAILYIARYLG